MDRAAAPAAGRRGTGVSPSGPSVIGAITVGIGIASSTAPTMLAVLMLLPLSAFEATGASAAAAALTRSRIAAARVFGLVPVPLRRRVSPRQSHRRRPHRICALSNSAPATQPGDRSADDDRPGSRCARLAVTGKSGAGKSALLMTLAGLLPPSEVR